MTTGRFWKATVALVKRTVKGWSDDKASSWAAALSFYTMVSLGPLLFIVVALCGLFLGRDAARDAVLGQMTALLGERAGNILVSMLEQSQQNHTGIIATVLGIVTLIAGSSGVFFALQDAFDAIWHVTPNPKASWWSQVRRRFLSLAMVAGLGFMLMVSLVASSVLSVVLKYVGEQIPIGQMLAIPMEFGLSLALFTIGFAGMFKVLPDARVQWRDVWVGAFATAFLFNIGKLAIGIYLGRSNVTSAYGAAGSLALILLWVYYAAQIVFLGAEFTETYATMHGSRVEPAADAVKVKTIPVARAI